MDERTRESTLRAELHGGPDHEPADTCSCWHNWEAQLAEIKRAAKEVVESFLGDYRSEFTDQQRIGFVDDLAVAPSTSPDKEDA